MVDRESVRRRLREIDRRVGLLGALHAQGRKAFIDDAGLQAQAERHLQLAIQAAIDIALHLVAENSAETAETYASAFAMLVDQGVLDEALAARLARATGLRNLLVHAYLDVDPSRIWDHLEHLDDLRDLGAAIERQLD